MITAQERKELARKFLNKLKSEEKAAIPSFEELKIAAQKPSGHFCDNCVDEYKQYNADKKARDSKWKDVYPECSGSKEYMPVTIDQWKNIHNFNTEEEAEDSYLNLRVTLDPILWAAAELNVIMEGHRVDPNSGKIRNFDRWYQMPMTRCSSKFKLFRCGRRCHVSDSLVHTNFGDMTFEQLKVNKQCAVNELKLRTYDIYTKALFYEHEFSVEDNGVVPCYRITSASGKYEEVSDNHPFLVNPNKRIFVEAENLSVGDTIYVEDADGVRVDHVANITFLGDKPTTAVTVYGTHTIVNNFISHNTGKTFTMVLEALHFMATSNKVRVLLVTPYEKQLAEFFDTAIELLKESSNLKNSYKYNKTIHQLEFLGNGSVVKSISTGGDKAGGGDKVRGQKADLIIYDECVVKGSRILTSSGYKAVEDITTADMAMYRGKAYPITAAKQTSDKECYRIEDYLGNVLECSYNHPINTDQGIVPAEDITPDHKVVIDYSPKYPIDKDSIMARLFGAWLYNGYIYTSDEGYKTFFYTKTKKDAERMVLDIQLIDHLCKDLPIEEYEYQLPHIDTPGYCIEVGEFISHGLLAMGALESSAYYLKDYRIPAIFNSYSDEVKQEFIAAFLGSIHSTTTISQKKLFNPKFEFYSKYNGSRNMYVLFWIKEYLNSIGFKYSIQYKSSCGSVTKRGSISFLNVEGYNLVKYIQQIGFRYNSTVYEDMDSCNFMQIKIGKINKDKQATDLLIKAKEHYDGNHFKLAKTLGISINRARLVSKYVKLDTLMETVHRIDESKSMESNSVYVKSVTPIGTKETYNITVDDVHMFVAEGIETHNCDYIAQGDIEASIAILLDNPDCKILMSTTPTGKRGFFYDRAVKKELRYKEFHHYSHASPSVTPAAHNEILEASSSSAFIREVLAEFGSETVGVFSPADIDRATKEYSLAESRKRGPVGGNKYIIGVDWNGKQIGVHMVVLEFSPETGKFKVADVVRVRNKQFTQDRAVTTIIELFKFWGASWVYLDAGDGGAQVEQILKYAQQTGDERLARAIVPTWMQSNTIIRNPISGEEEKRPTKHYAITLLGNRVERGLLILPKEEVYKQDGDNSNDSDWGLVTQMTHFSVEKVRDNGLPKYADTPDHTLVALYLAILGFQLKLTDLGGAAYDTYIGRRNDTVLGGGIVIEQSEEEKKTKALTRNFIPRDIVQSNVSTVSSGGMVGFSSDVLITNPNGSVRLATDVHKSRSARTSHSTPIRRTF